MAKGNQLSIPFDLIVHTLREAVLNFKDPAVTAVAEKSHDPYRVLISCVISLRTKDEVTEQASARLFQKADTPQAMMHLSSQEIEKLIYPAGFYRNKARSILAISEILEHEYQAKVPDTLDALLALPGVGRKTANLVLTLGFHKAAICVDTHVHRMANRLGWVQTRTPEQTEFALQEILPKKYWIEINDLLVTYGQNICKPVSPICSKCQIKKFCLRIGVGRSR